MDYSINRDVLIVYLLDTSASHLRNSGLKKSISFLSQQTQSSAQCIIQFGNDCIKNSGLLYQKTAFTHVLNGVKAGGGTPFLNAMQSAKNTYLQHKNTFLQQYLFIFTDGCFNIDTHDLERVHFDACAVFDTSAHLGLANQLARKFGFYYNAL